MWLICPWYLRPLPRRNALKVINFLIQPKNSQLNYALKNYIGIGMDLNKAYEKGDAGKVSF